MSEHVITLLANPSGPAMTEDFVRTVAQAVPTRDIRWLSPGFAVDLFYTVGGMQEFQSVNPLYLLRRALGSFTGAYAHTAEKAPHETQWRTMAYMVQNWPVDFILQPTRGRRKKLLISDMDSTMITVECIDELADFVGKKAEVAAITERAMNGELVFEEALIERVALLAGLPESVLEQCYAERVRFTPGAAALVATMRAGGAHTVLVSGGFTFFTERVARGLGFHEHQANVLEVENGVLTGKVKTPILGKEAKLAALKDACSAQALDPSQVLAVGDGANDLPMLLHAGMGVAYRAKPRVQEEVWARLNFADLDALLYAQGYKESEIRRS